MPYRGDKPTPQKNPIFSKNRIFKPQKNPIFSKKIGFLNPKKKSDFYPRSAAKRGNACLHRSAVQFVHTPMWFKPEQVLFI
jgi:hypothetical protein